MLVNIPLTKKLFRDLWHRRFILLALILILGIGVGTYIGMANTYLALDSARAQYYDRYHLADFTIDLTRAPTIILPQLKKVADNNVIHLQTRIKEDGMVTIPKRQVIQPIPATILSLPTRNLSKINNVKLDRGGWFSGSYAREAIIDEQFAEAQHLLPGDRINVRLPTKEYNLLVVGTASSPEYVFLLPPGNILSPDPTHFAVVYMPEKLLQQASQLNSAFNQLIGSTHSHTPVSIKNSMNLLGAHLDRYGVQLKTAQHDQVSVKVLHDELQEIQSITSLFPTIFLFVAAMVLNVMLCRIVAQQRTAIGTLKALGYSNRSILTHFLCYGLSIGMIGSLVGVGIGIALEQAILSKYSTFFRIPNMHLLIPFSTAATGVTIGLVCALLGSFVGAYHAIRLTPVDAMRPPLPEKNTYSLLEKFFPSFWTSLSFKNKMVFRAIFRNRFRSIATICASIISTALVFSSIALLDSSNLMVSLVFDNTQHFSYDMTLRDPLGHKSFTQAKIIHGARRVEPQLIVPSELQHGPYTEQIQITGLPKYHYLYTPFDKARRPIQIPSDGIVLSQILAKKLHAQLGDKIILKPLLGLRKQTKTIVRDIIPTYLGISAYANQLWLSRLLGNTWLANHFLFLLKTPLDNYQFSHKVKQFEPMINLSNRQDSRRLMIDTLNQFMVFFIILMIIFAAIISIGAIINNAMISFNERERDVASLRMLGFDNLQVAKIFFGESFILNTFGMLIGLVFGAVLTYYSCVMYSTDMYRMPFVLFANRFFETIILMLIFTVLSQAVIYRAIVTMNWFTIVNTRE